MDRDRRVRLDAVQTGGDNPLACAKPRQHFYKAILDRAGLDFDALGRGFAVAGSDPVDEGPIAFILDSRFWHGDAVALPLLDGDTHQHAGAQPIAGIGELRPGDNGARCLVDAGIDKGNSALERLVAERVGGRRDGQASSQHVDISLGHREIDTDGPDVVQGRDHRTGVDQRARRDAAEAQDTAEGCPDRTIALAGFGRLQCRARYRQLCLILLDHHPGGVPLLAQGRVAFILFLGEPHLSPCLNDTGLLLARLQLHQGGASRDLLPVPEENARDQLAGVGSDVDRAATSRHAQHIDLVAEGTGRDHRSLDDLAAPTPSAARPSRPARRSIIAGKRDAKHGG